MRNWRRTEGEKRKRNTKKYNKGIQKLRNARKIKALNYGKLQSIRINNYHTVCNATRERIHERERVPYTYNEGEKRRS